MKNIFKIILSIALCFAMSICLLACGKSKNEQDAIDESMFCLIEMQKYDGARFYKVYDKETKVVYLIIYHFSTHASGGHEYNLAITVLYDENGNPMIWEE